MIAIVDYKAGNLASVKKAFDHLGASTLVTAEADEVARAENLLPVGLSRGAVLTRALAAHEPITLADVDLPDTYLLRLWRQQALLP